MVGVSVQLPRLDRAFALLLTVVGVGAAAFTWLQVVRTISQAQPPALTMQATSIVWDDRVFQSPAQLARWLRSRGATYGEWSKQHPAGRDLLEHRPVTSSGRTPPAARRSKAVGATRTAAPAKHQGRDAAPPSRPERTSTPHGATTGIPTLSPITESPSSGVAPSSTVSPSSANSPSAVGYPVGRIFIACLAFLAAACACAAALPGALLQRFPNLARTIGPYRTLLLGGAAALMIGIVAGAVLN
jgi:hypothetical protein